MNEMYKGQERRKFKRVKVKLVVIYRKDRPLDVTIHEGDKEVKATMLDISEGGISILTEADIPVSTTILIRFTLIKTDKDHADFYGNMELRGEVRYNRLTGKSHRVGICFLDISDADKHNIADFVQTIESQPKKD